jgi:hypothetical protein
LKRKFSNRPSPKIVNARRGSVTPIANARFLKAEFKEEAVMEQPGKLYRCNREFTS